MLGYMGEKTVGDITKKKKNYRQASRRAVLPPWGLENKVSQAGRKEADEVMNDRAFHGSPNTPVALYLFYKTEEEHWAEYRNGWRDGEATLAEPLNHDGKESESSDERVPLMHPFCLLLLEGMWYRRRYILNPFEGREKLEKVERSRD